MAGFVPAVVARLLRRYPKVTVQVVAAQPGEQEFPELRDRSVDLSVGRLFRPLVTDDVDAEILSPDTFFVVASAHSPWARRRKIALADLIDEPWILFPPNSIVNSYIQEAFHLSGLTLPRQSVTSFSIQMRLHLLSTGRFLTILHGSVLRFNAKIWSLKILPIDLSIRPMPIAVFTLKNRTLNPVAQIFIKEARETAKMISAAPATGHS